MILASNVNFVPIAIFDLFSPDFGQIAMSDNTFNLFLPDFGQIAMSDNIFNLFSPDFGQIWILR